jgi:2-dehydro-3-deoxygalactonokinase
MADDGWDDAAFDAGVAEGLSRPEKISARLFGLRAEGLLHGLAPAAARARLSGLLIGLELAGAKGYWLGQQVAIVGAEVISAAYARALAAQGVSARLLSATDCTLRGLATLRAKETVR